MITDWLEFTEEERAATRREIDDEMESVSIPCAACGKSTTWDPTYQNLCYRRIRATNE